MLTENQEHGTRRIRLTVPQAAIRVKLTEWTWLMESSVVSASMMEFFGHMDAAFLVRNPLVTLTSLL
jgi:hypothetical protein